MRGEVHQGSDAGGQSCLKDSQTYAISARVPTPFEVRAKGLTRGYNTTEMAADGALGGDHQSSRDHLDLSRQLHTDWGYEPLSLRIFWRAGEGVQLLAGHSDPLSETDLWPSIGPD